MTPNRVREWEPPRAGAEEFEEEQRRKDRIGVRRAAEGKLIEASRHGRLKNLESFSWNADRKCKIWTCLWKLAALGNFTHVKKAARILRAAA